MYKLIKRTLDFIIAFLLIIIAAPFCIILTIILWVHFGFNTPFFTQKRPGKNERIFTLVKFRTMSLKRDASGNLLPDADRLTGLGKLVRKLSLDEIPQTINVLKGDMSLIGPRPLLCQYLELYNETQRKRHLVRPGITGWAQVNGRNAISWEQKFKLDVWYVENMSFMLDMKIFLLTVKKIFQREGINAPGQATADYFKGSN